MKDKSKSKMELSDLSEMPHDWSKIRHFFIWPNKLSGKNYFVFINRCGTVKTVRIEGKGAYNKYCQSWEQWNEQLASRPLPAEFFFPQWVAAKEFVHTLSLDMALKFGVVLLLSILVFGSQHRAGLIIAIFFLVILLILVLPHILSLLRGKRMFQVSIMEGGLKVAFSNGLTREMNLAKLKYYCFEPYNKNCFAFFNDGTRLNGLQMLSDWPILREHLLSVLRDMGRPEEVFNTAGLIKTVCVCFVIGLTCILGLIFTAHGAIYENKILAGIFFYVGLFSLLLFAMGLRHLHLQNKYAKQKESSSS